MSVGGADAIASSVAAISGCGLVGTLPSFALISRLPLSGAKRFFLYCAAAIMTLCYALILWAMWEGLATRWTGPVMAGMLTGGLLTIPAFVSAILFFIAGIAAKARWAIKSYFIGMSLFSILLLGIPALVFLVLVMPGHA